MDFASQTFDADGRAAFALTVAIIQHLKLNGILKDADGREIVGMAAALLPNGGGRLDTEARQVLDGLLDTEL